MVKLSVKHIEAIKQFINSKTTISYKFINDNKIYNYDVAIKNNKLFILNNDNSLIVNLEDNLDLSNIYLKNFIKKFINYQNIQNSTYQTKTKMFLHLINYNYDLTNDVILNEVFKYDNYEIFKDLQLKLPDSKMFLLRNQNSNIIREINREKRVEELQEKLAVKEEIKKVKRKI